MNEKLPRFMQLKLLLSLKLYITSFAHYIATQFSLTLVDFEVNVFVLSFFAVVLSSND